MINKKNIVLAVLAFSITLIVCNKDKGISQPPEMGELFTLSGTVSDEISNQPVVSALVINNNLTATTDSSGKFKFDSLKAGIYHLIVVHMNYDTTTFDINLQSDIDKNIKLTRRLIDYLPLYQGEKWTYYKDFYQGLYDHYLGEALWEVININVEDTLTKYEIRETFNGIRISVFPPYDTTIINDAIINFPIKESLNHKIYLSYFYFGDYVMPFDRFYPVFSPDTIIYSYNKYEFEVKLKKETGMVYIFGTHTGMSTAFSVTYTLLSSKE